MSNSRRSLSAALLHSRFLPVCFGIYLGTRALVAVAVPVVPTSDEAWYFARGVDIAQGRGYSEGGVPTAYWPIGWPGLLGAVFSVFPAVAVVGVFTNLWLAAGSFWLLWALARDSFGDKPGARVGLILLALYPNGIAYPSLLLAETFATFLVLLAAFIAVRGQGFLVAVMLGVVVGLAGLTRPPLLALLPILLVLRVVDRWHIERRWHATTFCVIAILFTLLTPVPWMVRNTVQLGAPVLISTNGGINLLIGNNPQARGGYGSIGSYRHAVAFSIADQVAADARARTLAWRWIREHPAAFLTLVPRKLFWLWAPDGEAEWAYQAGYAGYGRYKLLFRAVRIVNQAYYLALLGGATLALPGLVRKVRRGGSPWQLLGVGVALHATAVCAVFYGASRYHAIAMPFLAIYAGDSAWRAMSLDRTRFPWYRLPRGGDVDEPRRPG